MAYAHVRIKKIGSIDAAEAAVRRIDPAALGRLHDLLPAQTRCNAIHALEYLFSASPQWWRTSTPEQQALFFSRARQWLLEHCGEELLVVSGDCREAGMRGLAAYVVPLKKNGKLSARAMIEKTRRTTTFALAVADLGLLPYKIRRLQPAKPRRVKKTTKASDMHAAMSDAANLLFNRRTF